MDDCGQKHKKQDEEGHSPDPVQTLLYDGRAPGCSSSLFVPRSLLLCSWSGGLCGISDCLPRIHHRRRRIVHDNRDVRFRADPTSGCGGLLLSWNPSAGHDINVQVGKNLLKVLDTNLRKRSVWQPPTSRSLVATGSIRMPRSESPRNGSPAPMDAHGVGCRVVLCASSSSTSLDENIEQRSGPNLVVLTKLLSETFQAQLPRLQPMTRIEQVRATGWDGGRFCQTEVATVSSFVAQSKLRHSFQADGSAVPLTPFHMGYLPHGCQGK